jgi:hypothetical protein
MCHSIWNNLPWLGPWSLPESQWNLLCRLQHWHFGHIWDHEDSLIGYKWLNNASVNMENGDAWTGHVGQFWWDWLLQRHPRSKKFRWASNKHTQRLLLCYLAILFCESMQNCGLEEFGNSEVIQHKLIWEGKYWDGFWLVCTLIGSSSNIAVYVSRLLVCP